MEVIKEIGNIALLIDVENVSSKYIKHIFDELANYGVATYKRAYTDWTVKDREFWKKELLEYAITPVQQYSYTHGKNSSDSALIIDAMDIMYSKNVKGFCIVSSDSDFIKLITRLREEGMYVIGMGELKTSKNTIAAYDKFIFLDVLFGNDKKKTQTKQTKTKKNEYNNYKKEKETKDDTPDDKNIQAKITQNFVEEILSIIDVWTEDDGWANLANVGNLLVKRDPSFDPRTYGFKKLNDMVKTIDELDIKLDSGRKICYVRRKQ